MSKKRTRQRRGSGGLIQKNGKYEGRYRVYKQDGTFIEKSFTRKSEIEIGDIKAALRVLGVIDNDVEKIEINKHTNQITLIRKGTALKNKMKVQDYIDYYLWNHRRKGLKGKVIEDTTFSGYVDRLNFVKEQLGKKYISELSFEDIEEALIKIHKDTCDSTAKQTKDLVVSMMKYAKRDGIIKENVLADREINFREHKGKKKKKILNKEEEVKLLQYCLKNKEYAILMIFFTGMRCSELARINLE